jgi:hypothetical protein
MLSLEANGLGAGKAGSVPLKKRGDLLTKILCQIVLSLDADEREVWQLSLHGQTTMGQGGREVRW